MSGEKRSECVFARRAVRWIGNAVGFSERGRPAGLRQEAKSASCAFSQTVRERKFGICCLGTKAAVLTRRREMSMKRIAVVTNAGKDKDGAVSAKIGAFLKEKQVSCTFCGSGEEVPDDSECVLVLGGDGTLLRAAKEVVDRQIPLLGINLGTLGYLAEVEAAALVPALSQLLRGEYTIEKRMMLHGTHMRGGEKIGSDIALNDVVLIRRGHLRVLSFENSVNGSPLNSYQADGIIISTPTGSTGYSLSVGGPIVTPDADLILMTAIAPHTLNTRSVIFKGTDEVTVRVADGHTAETAEADVAFDGNAAFTALGGDRIVVRRAMRETNILKLSDRSFLEVLRRKMADT